MIASFVNINCTPSERIQHQGNWDSVKPYLKKGFHIVTQKNGFWVLVKTTSVKAIVELNSKTYAFDVKADILNYYGLSRISNQAITSFADAAKNGNILFDIDESNNSYKIVAVN